MSEPLRASLLTEYYKLVDTVSGFDNRLLTIKGWGVTVSLAALSLGFQQSHYGLFLVAALSGLGFWAIEGVVKRHQMRTYVRMRDIEVSCYELFPETTATGDVVSSPLIDWSWEQSRSILMGRTGVIGRPERRGVLRSYRFSWLLLGVFMPHLISVVAGFFLFFLARCHQLSGFQW